MSDAEFAWLRAGIPAADLRAGGDHVRDLLTHPGWEFLTRVLAHSQQRELEAMISRGPHDQATYAEKAGFIRALKVAHDAPHAVVRLADSERERRQRDAEQAEQEGR